jgi:hypothetical protein
VKKHSRISRAEHIPDAKVYGAEDAIRILIILQLRTHPFFRALLRPTIGTCAEKNFRKHIDFS